MVSNPKPIMQHHSGATSFGDGWQNYKAHVMNNENYKTRDKNGGETKEWETYFSKWNMKMVGDDESS